jgi:hypothetical protein
MPKRIIDESMNEDTKDFRPPAISFNKEELLMILARVFTRPAKQAPGLRGTLI